MGIERTVGAVGDAFIAEFFRGEDGDGDEGSREFVLEGAIFGPGIEAIEDDAFLTSGDEVFGLGDSLFADPVFAFGFANHFAEGFFALAIRGAFDATFGHFAINHVAEVDLGVALFGEKVDGDRFAGAGHAENGKNFEIFGISHKDIVA